MIVHPNETRVEAVVRHIAPSAGGYGHDLDLEILETKSPDPKLDYLKPKAGDRIKVFAAEPGALKEGWRVRATLGLSGGPFEQRAVLRSAEPIAATP